jgi:putative tryptophan/tyrosine transport system substrate-binding protein
MRRRDLISLVSGSAFAWPLAARAQQPGEHIRRIGVLQDTAEDDPVRKKQFARFDVRRVSYRGRDNLDAER